MLVLEERVVACRVSLALYRWPWRVRMQGRGHLVAIRGDVVGFSGCLILGQRVARIIDVDRLVAVRGRIELRR